ncbi:NAD(P)/FAD-dependent oxidoreductase [uncultured Demequina sp.]|uniref:FAD-dependent oxidoreductase n=1 Tax=uncultured Demequina sp. TaxID=693499 RepID=UPI0025F86787|nr:FAD-dependent oxidoreductase [uncultured Demequina sp.]
MTTRHENHAVVVGAGIAGLLAARALSDHVAHVTILERTRVDDAVGAAPTAAGLWPACTLTPPTLALLEARMPGLAGDLLRAGAVPVARDGAPSNAYRPVDHPATLALTERLVLDTVRRRLLHDHPNVSVHDGVHAERALLTGRRITGVSAAGAAMNADLVVDATGRGAQLLASAIEDGVEAPTATSVVLSMDYRTRIFARSATAVAMASTARDARGGRVATLAPIEGDRWAVTLGTWPARTAPTTPAGFSAAIETLGDPALAMVVDGCEPRSSLGHATLARTRLRRPHLSTTPLDGLVLVGDSLCTLDPLAGVSVRSASLQAHMLAAALSQHAVVSPELTAAYHRWAGAAVERPWREGSGAATVASRPRAQAPARVARSLARLERSLAR